MQWLGCKYTVCCSFWQEKVSFSVLFSFWSVGFDSLSPCFLWKCMIFIFFTYFLFFNVFWMMVGRKLANLFEKFWLSWHLSMLMFRFYPSVFGLLIAIDAWFEMIYVKYKNIFFRITYQLTLWGVFCACWTHRFWKVYPNPMQPWSGVQSCCFFAH